MNYTIKNKFLAVDINSIGAELWSIKKDGVEHLWQSSETSWKGRATNLFPCVGRLQDSKYTFEGKTYEMGIHGIARYIDFAVAEQTEEKIVFVIESDEETAKAYPFSFKYFITYELKEDKILINSKVLNTDNKTMYFALGGHPGFITPFENGINFEDYYLEFDEEAKPIRVKVAESGLVTDEREDFLLENNKILNLKHNLFDTDAIILKDMCSSVSLKCKKSDLNISVKYDDMNYLVIWQSPKLSPNFLCLEPWTSIPGRDKIIEDFKTKPTLLNLDTGKEYNNNWSIQIN